MLNKIWITLALAVLVGAPTAAAQQAGIESVENGCPLVDEFGGSPAILVSEELPAAGQPQTLSMFTASPNSLGVMLIGYEPAQFARAGCPLIFLPVMLTPIATDGQGFVSLPGRWPAAIDASMHVYAQGYIMDGASPTGFFTTNTLDFSFFVVE